MQPQRILGIVLVIAGVVLLVMGIQAADSISSSFSKFFTGSPTDRAVWMTIGGIVCIVAGGGLSLIPSRGGKI